MAITVYHVVGEEGSHSDWTTWDVCAYQDKEHAQIHVNKANEWVYTRVEEFKHYHTREMLKNPYDPDHRYQLNGRTIYLIEEITLYAHWDEFLETKGPG